MKRRVLRFGAIIGAVTVSALAVAPAFAAAATSQSTAQSLQLSIAGNSAISQKISATNDGTKQTKNDVSTIPTLASVLPENNLIGAGVTPQDAVANADGTSYACAGITGTGGGIARVGTTACNIDGKPLTIDLANLDLGNVILGTDSALGNALQPILNPLNDPVMTQLIGTIVGQVTNGIKGTPLGQIKIGGSLSAIEAACVADPDKASGTTHLVDTSGGSNATPISVTLPDGSPNGKTLTLLNLPANPPVNTHVVVDLDTVTQTLIDGIKVELNTALDGALKGLGLGDALQKVQDALVTQLVANLQPLLQQVQDNLLDITLNKQSTGDSGRSVDVTALDLQVLPAAKQFTGGSSLLSGAIGHVTCGPNTRATTVTPNTPVNPAGPHNPASPDVPNVVNSGLAGNEDHTARNVLGATAALMLLAGTAGLVGYRRMLNK